MVSDNDTQSGTGTSVSVNELIRTDPEIKALLQKRLDDRKLYLEQQLQSLAQERQVLEQMNAATISESPSPKKKAVAKKTASKGKGRPVGSTPGHTDAILTYLKRYPDQKLPDIYDGMQKKGHSIDRKLLSTYLSKLATDGRVVSAGTRRSQTYRLA